MSENTKNKLKALKESSEVFNRIGLNWLAATSKKEYKILSEKVRTGAEKSASPL